MAEALFDVIADGRPAAGFDAAAVTQQLQQQLKLTALQAERLLGGKAVVAKRAVAQPIAEKYCARLGAVGLSVHIEACADELPTPTPLPDVSSANRTVDAAEQPAAVNFFAGTATPLTAARTSARYLQQLVAATTQVLWIALSYSGITLLGITLLGFYSWHFGHLLSAPPLLFSIPVFVLPWLALLLLVILLLRPFYPQQRSSVEPTLLLAQQQPQLFAWLTQLCELIAAPEPQAVAIDTGVAHSVNLCTGSKAFWRGDYQLTLSLPALDISTLADSSGLLVATLGSQARPAALRCYRILQIVDQRLSGCLENRDWLNLKIAAIEQQFATSKLIVLLGPLRKLIAEHNRLLTRFSVSLKNIQQRLQRHTLLEADRLQTLSVGAEHFAESLLQQHKLAEAHRDANALNFQDRSDGRLVADLPALIRHYYDNFDPKTEQALRKQWSEVVTRSTALLPTPGERIEAAHARDANAAFTATALAATLTATRAATLPAQQPALAAQVTHALYTELGLSFDPAALLPVDELTFAATEDMLHKQQATLYFNNWFRPFRFWRLADYTLIRDMPSGDAAMQLNVCINEIRRLTPDRMRLLNEYERLQNQIQELLIGQLVMAQGRPYPFRYVAYDGTTLQPLLEERQQQMAKVMEQLATQETIMGGRITLGLRLSGQAPRDAADLHRALMLSSAIENRLYKLALDVFQLEQLVQRHYTLRDADYSAPIKRLEEKIKDASALLHVRLKDIPYPLDARYATLNDYVTMLFDQSKNRPGKSPTLERAKRLLQILYGVNEALARLAADSGTIAEEAYNIEPIKLIGTL